MKSTIFILSCISIVLACFFIIITAIKKYVFSLKQYKEKRSRILLDICSFNTMLDDLNQSFISHNDELEIIRTWKYLFDDCNSFRIRNKNDQALTNSLNKFVLDYSCIHKIVISSNVEFIKQEKVRCDSLLSNIDGKSLDDQQRTIVVSDEDHTLVLAGAGSGKTLTISAKVLYLCNEKHIKPADILLISFTNKATSELSDRIKNKLDIDITASTFHKVGLDIISSNSGERPDVAENDPMDFLNNYFNSRLSQNKNLVNDIITYFSFYVTPPANLDEFNTLGEAYEYQRYMDFETIKSKYNRETIKEKFKDEADKKIAERITLAGERVKSIEEVIIANFLFLNGIEYEYEKLYPFKSNDKFKKPYHPDFYLTEYNIYLEHFGINRQGKLPWLSKIEEEKYLDSIKWKRNFHKQNGTTLLETYSYYNSDGVLLEKLEELLKNNNVEFKEPDIYDIFSKTYGKKSDKYFKEFIKLCSTFITLFKSNNYTSSDLQKLNYKNKKYANRFYTNRTEIFKRIINPIIRDYEAYLEDKKCVDFSDMINIATDNLKQHQQIHEYKYVIIDEFQDISMARYRLVKEILNATNAKLLCVGDDWQSIYRFAGSDISIFTEFKEHFGYSDILKIEKTYRNPQLLIDIVGNFIMKNPMQLKKNLSSSKNIENPICFFSYANQSEFDKVMRNIFDEIIKEFSPNSSVIILGRTKYDFEPIENSRIFSVNNQDDFSYIFAAKMQVKFLTVHKSKGLEADNIILLNFKNDILGFPNKISDDPLLELVLSNKDTYIYSEERRLLYVALTRTKNRAYVTVDERKPPSEFLHDFEMHHETNISFKNISNYSIDPLYCPHCQSGKLRIVKNETNDSTFLGCTNYPQCNYTIKDIKVLNNKHICPSCGGILVHRESIHGSFWGCSNYPKCKYIQNIYGD